MTDMTTVPYTKYRCYKEIYNQCSIKVNVGSCYTGLVRRYMFQWVVDHWIKLDVPSPCRLDSLSGHMFWRVTGTRWGQQHSSLHVGPSRPSTRMCWVTGGLHRSSSLSWSAYECHHHEWSISLRTHVYAVDRGLTLNFARQFSSCRSAATLTTQFPNLAVEMTLPLDYRGMTPA